MASERIENILLSVNDKVQRLMEADRFYVALYDPVRASLEFPLVVDDGNQIETGQTPWTVRPYQGRALLLDRVIDQRAQLFFEYALGEKLAEEGMAYWPDDEPPLSWLGIPMTFEGQVIGVLVTENRHKSRAFGDSGVRVLSTIARQTAMAIQNIRLYERLDRKIASLGTANEMGRQLTSGIRLSEPEILRLIYQQASRLMDTNNMYIALYEEATDTVRFGLMHVNGKPKSVEPRAGGHGRTEWIIHNKEPIFITAQAESKAWYKQPGRTEYIGQPFASWIGVPMIAGQGKVMGVIATYHTTKEYLYDQDDLDVLSLMAGQSAVAIENARLYETLEQRVKERTQDLADANEELRRARERETLTVLGEVAAGLVHKMSGSLGLIPFWTERIENAIGPVDETTAKRLRNIREGAQDALSYTSGMAKIIKLEKVSKEAADIKVLLGNALRQAIPNPKERGISLETHYAPGLPALYVNAPLINEAFQNLIRNAMEAMPSGGNLSINLESADGEGVQVQITDTGCGIPEDKQPNLFRAGFSLKKEGKGIGLWFCKRVIDQQHQGTIDCESREGIGTTFTVFLPVGQPTSEDEIVSQEKPNV